MQNAPYSHKPKTCLLKVSYHLTPAKDKAEPEPSNQKNPGSEKRETEIRRRIEEINFLSLTI